MAIKKRNWMRNLWDDVAFTFSGLFVTWASMGLFRLFYMDVKTHAVTIGGMDGVPFMPMQLLLVSVFFVGLTVLIFGIIRTTETLVRRYRNGDRNYMRLY